MQKARRLPFACQSCFAVAIRALSTRRRVRTRKGLEVYAHVPPRLRWRWSGWRAGADHDRVQTLARSNHCGPCSTSRLQDAPRATSRWSIPAVTVRVTTRRRCEERRLDSSRPRSTTPERPQQRRPRRDEALGTSNDRSYFDGVSRPIDGIERHARQKLGIDEPALFAGGAAIGDEEIRAVHWHTCLGSSATRAGQIGARRGGRPASYQSTPSNSLPANGTRADC